MLSSLNVCAEQHSAVKVLALGQLGGVFTSGTLVVGGGVGRSTVQLCVITLSTVIDPANTINPD